MNEKEQMDLERLYDQVSKLRGTIEGMNRNGSEYKQWHTEFDDVMKAIINSQPQLAAEVEAMRDKLNKNNPDAPGDPSKPLSKEEKVKMAKQINDLNTLFAGGDAMAINAVEMGHIKAEEVQMMYVEYMCRIMGALPDDNEYKKLFKHLKNRLENGDEIKSILDASKRIRPAKKKVENAPKVKAEGLTISPDSLENWKALALGAAGAALVGAAPGMAKKAANSEFVAGLASQLGNMLQGMAGVETDVAIEEEVDDEVEVEVDDEVTITI